MEFSFLEILILVLIGLLFFKETALGWISQKLGFKTVESDQPEPSQREVLAASRNGQQVLLSQMETLSQHYNHETTPLLERIVEEHKVFRETQLKQCGILEELRDIHRDMQRNGIRIRN